jgi:hypothetical protein
MAKDTDINCTNNSAHICYARCQPLLQAPRLARRTNIFQQADFIGGFVFILWTIPCSIFHQLLSCSKRTFCVTCTAPDSSPKIAHEHCNDLPKHCIHHFKRKCQVLEFSWEGGGAAGRGRTFNITGPNHGSFLMNWTLMNLAHSASC